MTGRKWDQKDFDKMISRWSPRRRARDEKALAKIFALAESSPAFAAALAWADKNGLRFFIDRKIDSLGYYTPGTGVLGIASDALLDTAEAIATIIHEIRHAWQECNGLSSDEGGDVEPSFRDGFLRTALTEADAEAWGLLAKRQYLRSQVGLPLALPAAQEKEELAFGFLLWFNPEAGHAWTYGDGLSKDFGVQAGIYKGRAKKQKYEFKTRAEGPLGGTIGIDNLQDVRRLGVSFSGGSNYLAALPSDILVKRILRPSLADTFWGAADAKEMKRTAALRKYDLREKLGVVPKKRRFFSPA